MSNQYDETIDFLYNLEKFGISFGLHKISALLLPFDNPQDKLKVIHIAGSNGKGSTAAFIESILMAHGFSVGLYTSPHLVKFNERIRINQQDITDEDIVKYVNDLKPYYEKINLKDPVTFFDFTTALAYKYFYDNKVDFAIMETGLGGTLDSTNVIKKSFISIVTNISKEHEEFLGSNLEDIAKEKAGIIKENGIVVTGENNEKVLNVFRDICNNKKAKLYILDEEVSVYRSDDFIFTYTSSKNKFELLKSSLLGEYQIKNSSLAIFSLEKVGFKLNYELLKKGLQNVKWQGRLEKVMDKPLFIIDGAHNPAGAKALRDSLNYFNFKKLILICSVMKDKDIDNFLATLLGFADIVIFTQAQIERAADIELLREKGLKYNNQILIEKNIANAIKKSIEISSKDDMICFTGSLYAVGEAKEFFGSTKGNFSMGNLYKKDN